ncbi:MAG: electron transfer flavoprotein subunit beta/FixA family protein, partial [Dehalococcoidales bacterium]|nr:electron transfer flavoprotein subunit beta/FixA family protein [Dehalococcoidales bacterium]
MNIVVCLKQVPGTTDVKINRETNTLIRQGIENIINPFDTYALEEAVRIKEKHGGKVTVITMGPPQADAALREAISLGADEVILLSDRAFSGADTWATAFTLSQAIRKLESYDLIICGKQTIDGDTGQVGPEMAEMLKIPFIAYVSEIEEINGSQLRLRRLMEEGHEVIESALPAIITVAKEINVPRLPSLRGIMKSKSARIETWDLAALGTDENSVGLAGSSTQVIKIFFPQRVHQAEMLEGTLEEKTDKLIGHLKGSGLC